MSNRKFIRRTLLVATITISGAHATTASGFQQDLYQPGQPGQQIPQGNSTVTHELNRMFQESGQQMPSMNAKDLPNANVPIQGQVRPRQTTNQSQVNTNSVIHAESPQKGSSGKQSVLGRFFSKLRGNTDNNNSNFRPPVPPDDNSAAQSPATIGNMRQSTLGQNSLPQQGQLTKNALNRPSQSQNPQHGPRLDAVQADHAGKRPMPQATLGATQSAAQVRNGAASSIPPRPGTAVRPANSERPASSSANSVGERIEYTQPGSAPGFMSTAGAVKVIQNQTAAVPLSRDKFQDQFIRENTGGTIGTQQKAETAAPEVAVKNPSADEFKNPFSDLAESSEATETLDLDSLIDIPAATPEPVATVTKGTQPLEPADASEATPAAEELSESGGESAESDASENAGEEMDPKGADVESDENPFTGVQLNTSDSQFFDVGDQGQSSGVDVGSSGVPIVPLDDFNSNLPSVDLPLIDEKAVGAGVELIETPSTETVQPTQDATQAESTTSAGTAAGAELKPNVDVPEAMNAAETARLRETAEQERRQLQQRQIQARAGRPGFKGFCPVALRERRELVESSDQFTSTFGLQMYTFSSAEFKAAFDADPSRYAPAAGGNDVVVLVNSGEEQAGQLDYALWYRDRLYLFRSRETMILFSKDPQRFASQY